MEVAEAYAVRFKEKAAISKNQMKNVYKNVNEEN